MRPVSRWALRAAVSLVALAGAGPAGAEVLYDQYNNPGPFASSSQNYETSQNAFDTELADDFVVAAANGWLVNQIDIDGQYFNGPGPASTFNVRFYADAGGLPGSEVAARTNVSFTPGPETGDVVIALTPGIPLAPGTYWLSVQANQNFIPAGQWGWTDRTVQSNQGAAWRNPGNGLGTGCTAWGRRATTCNVDAASPDQVYRISGNIGAGGPQLVHDLMTIIDEDGDGHLEPGESFGLDERIRNTGGETSTGISSVLTAQSAGVTVTQPNSAYPDVPAGGTATNTTRFEGEVGAAVACGVNLNLRLNLTTAQGTFQIDPRLASGGLRLHDPAADRPGDRPGND